ncbi:MAG TPA: alkaline phosphatase family protein [Candidatus Sulfotelmatobacter sp.]|jgi:acid phosphatase
MPVLILSPAVPAHSQTLPAFGHVVIVLGENAAYNATYNSTNMPYLTSLANSYGLGTNYYSDTHPSIGNYFNLATGHIISNDDTKTPKTLPVSDNNIALEAQNAGKTWRDYVENLPSAKNCGGLKSGKYLVRHDPLAYMTTINTETKNFVCFSQFKTDIANKSLPNFSWLVPNGCDDAHDCDVTTFDNWLSAEVAPLLASSYFQAGGDGLLVIVFDEDNSTGAPNCEATKSGQGCGGKVEVVMISPYSKKGYKSKDGDGHNYHSSYEEGNILRTMAQGLGLPTSELGAATADIPMSDFF